jgi:hypothetical protein
MEYGIKMNIFAIDTPIVVTATLAALGVSSHGL